MAMYFLEKDQMEVFVERCVISLFLKFHPGFQFVKYVDKSTFVVKNEQREETTYSRTLIRLFNRPTEKWRDKYYREEVDSVIVYKRNKRSSEMENVEDRVFNKEFLEEYNKFYVDPFSYIISNFFSGICLKDYGHMEDYLRIPEHFDLSTVLYKYKSFPNAKLEPNALSTERQRLQEFIAGTLAFSAPRWFNDPFDSDCEIPIVGTLVSWVHKLSGTTRSIEDLSDFFVERFCDYSEYFSGLGVANFFEAAYEKALDDLLTDLGMPELKGIVFPYVSVKDYFRILCLTPHYDDILMWGYYGDSGRGLCGGFRRGDIIDAVRAANTNCILVYGRMSYRTKINKLQYQGGPIWKFILKCVFTKYHIWKHEDEERFLLLKPSPSSPELIRAHRYNGFLGESADFSDWQSNYSSPDKWPQLIKDSKEYRLKPTPITP